MERTGRPGLFFGIALGISWLIWLPAAAGASGLLAVEVPTALLLIGGFGPALAALALVSVDHGWRGIRDLLARLLHWRLGLQWYAVVLLAPPAFLAVGIGAHMLLGGPAPDLANPPLLRELGPGAAAVSPLVFALLVFVQQVVGQIGEETGWRGYALPALQARTSAVAASLVIGILWGIWHLPLVAIPAAQAGVASIPIWLFLADIVATAIFYTWVYNHTRGSLLGMVLLHAINNTAAVFLPLPAIAATDIRPFVAVVVARWLVALALVAIAGPGRLTREPAGANPYYASVVRSRGADPA